MSTRRGGIPGPESRTGLVRPLMSEAEFERRQGRVATASPDDSQEPSSFGVESEPPLKSSSVPASTPSGRSRTPRARTVKPKRVQRMFALEEELDKKLWLYAIHVGKDRSEVINDLLRPVVASMVLYDSRDRRTVRPVEAIAEPSESSSE